jgi:lipopolysaccharide export system ATP-binding protein
MIRIDSFLAALRPHDVSLGMALLALLSRANDEGAMERGEWVASLRTLHGELTHGLSGAMAGPRAGTSEESGQETGRYLEEHVLGRLMAEGIARVEPHGEAWEQVRLEPALWADIRDRRTFAIERVEATVRNLLPRGDGSAELAGAAVIRPAGGSVLSARGLVKAFRKRKVVANVDLSVSQGEIVGLLGPNGAGKTTTFYMVVGLISPDSGRVFLDREELTRVPMYKRARKGIGYLAQEPSVFRKLSVEDNVMAILETMPIRRRERKARLEKLLDELGLRHLRKSKAYALSGGERRRLEITRALVSEPKFMLLDEPFAGVDPIAVHDIQQIVADLRNRGIGVIISDHNVEQTLDIVDRAYIMYDGRVRVSGTVAELVWSDEVAEIYFGPTLTARMRERYPRPEMVV